MVWRQTDNPLTGSPRSNHLLLPWTSSPPALCLTAPRISTAPYSSTVMRPGLFAPRDQLGHAPPPLHASRPHPILELCCARVSSRRGTSSDTLPPPPPLHASRPHPIQLCCARVSSRRGTSSDTLLPPPPLHASRPHTAQLPSAMRPGLFAPRDQLGHAPPSSTAARLSTAHCSTAFCNAPGSLRALRGLSSACSLLAIWHTEIR
jgi:hypothetical protein